METFKNPYGHFSKFVLRTPIVSFDYYNRLTVEDVVSNDMLREAYANPLIQKKKEKFNFRY